MDRVKSRLTDNLCAPPTLLNIAAAIEKRPKPHLIRQQLPDQMRVILFARSVQLDFAAHIARIVESPPLDGFNR